MNGKEPPKVGSYTAFKFKLIPPPTQPATLKYLTSIHSLEHFRLSLYRLSLTLLYLFFGRLSLLSVKTMSKVTLLVLSLWWPIIAAEGLSFAVPVLMKQGSRHTDVPQEYLHLARKYNVNLPDFESHLGITTVPAVNQSWDKEYLSPVKIGTPGQSLWMDFDTGSADT